MTDIPITICPECKQPGVRQEKNTKFGERFVDICGNGCMKQGTDYPLTLKWIPKTSTAAALPPLEPHSTNATVPADLSNHVTVAEMYKQLQEVRAAVTALQQWRASTCLTAEAAKSERDYLAPPPQKRSAHEVLMHPQPAAVSTPKAAPPQLWSDPFSSLN